MPRLEALRLPRGRALAPRRRPWRWLVLTLLAVLVTIAAALPAAWIARAVAARTDGRVVLADASGSLWQGSATLALSAGAGSQTATVLPGRLHWTVSFWPLLGGTLRTTVSHDEAMPAPVGLDITAAGWQAQAGAMRLPASLLEGVGAPFNTLRPDGAMRLDWTALQGRFRNAPGRPAGVYGHLTVRLDQVSSAVSRLRPLGSYRAEIDWTGRAGALRLSTVTGPLFLEGSGQIGARGRFEGKAHAAPEAETQLAALLSLLGRREDNVTRLRF
ncbi:type II secretion system protein N [Paracidovorax citrulli]